MAPDGLEGEIVCNGCGLVIRQPRASQDFTARTPSWHSNLSAGDSSTLREWLTTLRAISCQLELSDIIYREEAARIIRKKSSLLRSRRFGGNKRETAAALYYLVLRRYDKIQSLKEICEKLSLDYRLVKKCAWYLQEMADLQRPFPPEDYIRKYGWKIAPSPQLIAATEKLLASIRGEISGNPASLAAGALYNICKSRNMNITKDDVGQAFSISGRTVYSNERRIYKIITAKGLSSSPDAAKQICEKEVIISQNV